VRGRACWTCAAAPASIGERSSAGAVRYCSIVLRRTEAVGPWSDAPAAIAARSSVAYRQRPCGSALWHHL
jgi:hypothetical protein